MAVGDSNPGALSFARDSSVLVLAAHPDDESLGAGGCLHRALRSGARARVVLATDGENAPWIQRVFERRWRIGPEDRARFGRHRRGEARAAVAELGLASDALAFLGLPDQGITPALIAGERAPLAALVSELRAARPTLVLAPALGDLHPDHSALSVYLRLALARVAGEQPAPHLFEYAVHARGRVGTWREPLALALEPEERARKRAAILRYASQLSVHRKAYLGHARDAELFYEPDGPDGGAARHPLLAAEFVDGSGAAGTDGELRLRLRPRACLGAWGPITLLLCLERADGSLETLCVPLSSRASTVPVERALTRRVLGVARVVHERARGDEPARSVSFPLELLRGVVRVFAKLERSFGFFDEAGWLELGVPAAARAPATSPSTSPRATPAAPRACAVVPCYDVARWCGSVVREAAAQAEWVVAVDDGSRDGTAEELRAAAASAPGRIRVLTLPHNRGKGAALRAAFQHALAELPFDVLVTLDGDGQHDPRDIPRLVAACGAGADLAIGTRDLAAMPLRSRFGNTCTRDLLRWFHPAAPADTQSGLRAHSRAFLREVVAGMSGARYETELGILLLALERRRALACVPIATVYLDGNRSSHFHPLADSVRIYAHLLPRCAQAHLGRWRRAGSHSERRAARSGSGGLGGGAPRPVLLHAGYRPREQQEPRDDRDEGR